MMKRKRKALAVGFLSLAGCALMTALPLASSGQAGAPVPQDNKKGENKSIKPALPGPARWYLRELQAPFTILSTRYNQETRQVIWVLHAKKNIKNAGYHALFLDADFVKIADTEIRFTPSQKEYEKGTRIEAVLRIPALFDEANTVTVRAFR
jgi:hypothetical protein